MSNIVSVYRKEDRRHVKNDCIGNRKQSGGAAAEARILGRLGWPRTAGVSRQTIYAIEAGSYVPNTAVALRLARALEAGWRICSRCRRDAAPAGAPPDRRCCCRARIRSSRASRCSCAASDKRLMASPPSPVPWYFPPATPSVAATPQAPRRRCRFYRDGSRFPQPHSGGRLRSRHIRAGAARASRPASSWCWRIATARRRWQLLKEGGVHIAGTHLRDEASGESNLPEIAPPVLQECRGRDFVRGLGGRHRHWRAAIPRASAESKIWPARMSAS